MSSIHLPRRVISYTFHLTKCSAFLLILEYSWELALVFWSSESNSIAASIYQKVDHSNIFLFQILWVTQGNNFHDNPSFHHCSLHLQIHCHFLLPQKLYFHCHIPIYLVKVIQLICQSIYRSGKRVTSTCIQGIQNRKTAATSKQLWTKFSSRHIKIHTYKHWSRNKSCPTLPIALGNGWHTVTTIWELIWKFRSFKLNSIQGISITTFPGTLPNYHIHPLPKTCCTLHNSQNHSVSLSFCTQWG